MTMGGYEHGRTPVRLMSPDDHEQRLMPNIRMRPLQGTQNKGTASGRLLIIEDRASLPGNARKGGGHG